MSDLSETQRALAKILTDSKARHEYFQFRQSRAQCEPGDSPYPPLDSLKPGELERSAETLLRKRRSQTRSLFPRTAKALGAEYPRIFQRFAAERHFDGLHAIAREAIAFSDWLHQQPNVARWITELARWESLAIRWSRTPVLFQFWWFRYDIVSWLTHQEAPQSTPKPRLGITLVWRLGRYGKIVRIR